MIKAQNKQTNIQNGCISIFKSSKIYVQNGVLRKDTVKSIISIKRTGKALLVKKAKNKTLQQILKDTVRIFNGTASIQNLLANKVNKLLVYVLIIIKL